MKTLAEKFAPGGATAAGDKTILKVRTKFYLRLVDAIDPYVIVELSRKNLFAQVDDITREMLRFNNMNLSEQDQHTLAEQLAEDLYTSSEQMVLKTAATS